MWSFLGVLTITGSYQCSPCLCPWLGTWSCHVVADAMEKSMDIVADVVSGGFFCSMEYTEQFELAILVHL